MSVRQSAEKDAGLTERIAWERAILRQIIANAPSQRPDGGDITPDWISVITTAMLDNRTAAAAPNVGYVQKTSFGEWQATCTVQRCGWYFGRSKTQADAEKHMRGHAALVHPPRIPVTRVPSPAKPGDPS